MKNLNNYFLEDYINTKDLDLFSTFLCRIENGRGINRVSIIAFVDECNEELGIEVCNGSGFEIDMNEAILSNNFLDVLNETPSRYTAGTYFVGTTNPISKLIDYIPKEDRDDFHSFVVTEDEFMGLYNCLIEGIYIITVETCVNERSW